MKKIKLHFSIYLNNFCDFNCLYCKFKGKYRLNSLHYKKFIKFLRKLKKNFLKRNIQINFKFNLFGGEILLENQYKLNNIFNELKDISDELILCTKEIDKLNKNLIKKFSKIELTIHDETIESFSNINKLINKINYLSKFKNIIFFFSISKKENIKKLKFIIKKTYKNIQKRFHLQYEYAFYNNKNYKIFKKEFKKEFSFILKQNNEINEFFSKNNKFDYCLGFRIFYLIDLINYKIYPCNTKYVLRKNKENLTYSNIYKKINLFLRKNYFYCNKSDNCYLYNLYEENKNFFGS